MDSGISLSQTTFDIRSTITSSVSFIEGLFSAGETHIEIQDTRDIYTPAHFTITANIRSSDDVMTLLMLTNAIRNLKNIGNTPINLIIPYLPYSRQDRVCSPGQALSLKVFCDLINLQNYELVETWDLHSDVSLALLNKCTNIEVQKLLIDNSIFDDNEKIVLVSPDAGANKKIFRVAQELGIEHVVRADKTRDVKTGNITGTVVYYEHIGDKDFLIVDDICDGGRTFIELAKVLRPLTNGKIILFVTHGIFSKGIDVFEDLIDEVYTANPFNSEYEPFTNLLNKKETK